MIYIMTFVCNIPTYCSFNYNLLQYAC